MTAGKSKTKSSINAPMSASAGAFDPFPPPIPRGEAADAVMLSRPPAAADEPLTPPPPPSAGEEGKREPLAPLPDCAAFAAPPFPNIEEEEGRCPPLVPFA